MFITICTSCTGWRGDGSEFVYRGLLTQIRVLQKVGRSRSRGWVACRELYCSEQKQPHNSNGAGVRWREAEVKGDCWATASEEGRAHSGCRRRRRRRCRARVGGATATATASRSSVRAARGPAWGRSAFITASPPLGVVAKKMRVSSKTAVPLTRQMSAALRRRGRLQPAARRGRVRYWCFETKVKRLSRILAGAFAVSASAECIMPHPMQ